MTKLIKGYFWDTTLENPSVTTGLVILHQSGYKRTGLVALSVLEQVLTDAMADEAYYTGPVQTHVILEAMKTKQAD